MIIFIKIESGPRNFYCQNSLKTDKNAWCCDVSKREDLSSIVREENARVEETRFINRHDLCLRSATTAKRRQLS